MKYILAADPGVSGAIALLPDDGSLPIVIDLKPEGAHWEDQVIDIIQKWAPKLRACAVELVGSAPRNAAHHTAKLCTSSGILRGLFRLTARVYNIPYKLVTPQKWQSGIGLVTSKENLYDDQTPDERKKIRNRNKYNHKKAIYVWAKGKFPDTNFSKFQEGGSNQADALGIAYWMLKSLTDKASESKIKE